MRPVSSRLRASRSPRSRPPGDLWPSGAARGYLEQTARRARRVGRPATGHENSRSTMARPARPIARERRAGPTRRPGSRQPARDVAGRHEPAVLAGPHLVGQPAGPRRDDGPPVRHRFERHERAAFVPGRVHEHRGGLVPGVQVRVGDAARRTTHAVARARRASTARLERRPDTDPRRRAPSASPARPAAAPAARPAQRVRQHVEALVVLRGGRRSAARVSSARDAVALARAARPRRVRRASEASTRSMPFGIVRSWPGVGPRCRDDRARARDRWR